MEKKITFNDKTVYIENADTINISDFFKDTEKFNSNQEILVSKEFQDLITNGDLLSALSLCIEKYKDKKETHDTLVLLNARYKLLMADSAKGIIDYETLTKMRNGLTNDLINTIGKATN
jgi:hypothetical protein